MRAISILAVAMLAVACDATGTCVRPGRPGSRVHRGSCVVNSSESTCRGEFVESSGEAGAAVCRARGFTNAGGAARPLIPAEIQERLAAGVVVTFSPPIE